MRNASSFRDSSHKHVFLSSVSKTVDDEGHEEKGSLRVFDDTERVFIQRKN